MTSTTTVYLALNPRRSVELIEGPSRAQTTKARRRYAELLATAEAGYAAAQVLADRVAAGVATATEETELERLEEKAWNASEMAWDLECEFRAAGIELDR